MPVSIDHEQHRWMIKERSRQCLAQENLSASWTSSINYIRRGPTTPFRQQCPADTKEVVVRHWDEKAAGLTTLDESRPSFPINRCFVLGSKFTCESFSYSWPINGRKRV